MVSHYDCEKQHYLRQFNLLNVKQCTEALSNIQHANIQARTYVRAKAKRIRAFKCEAYAKKERKICFQGNVTLPTRRSFLKVLYDVCQVKKKQINFEQYYRIHVAGPKIAACESTSETVFVLNSAFTTKDNFFQTAIDDAIDAFNATLLDFGYTQQLQRYDPETHQVHTTSKQPFWPIT